MFTLTWNWLWDKHDQVKDLFTFFTKGISPKMAAGNSNDSSKTTSSSSNGSSDGKNLENQCQSVDGSCYLLLSVYSLLS